MLAVPKIVLTLLPLCAAAHGFYPNISTTDTSCTTSTTISSRYTPPSTSLMSTGYHSTRTENCTTSRNWYSWNTTSTVSTSCTSTPTIAPTTTISTSCTSTPNAAPTTTKSMTTFTTTTVCPTTKISGGSTETLLKTSTITVTSCKGGCGHQATTYTSPGSVYPTSYSKPYVGTSYPAGVCTCVETQTTTISIPQPSSCEAPSTVYISAGSTVPQVTVTVTSTEYVGPSTQSWSKSAETTSHHSSNTASAVSTGIASYPPPTTWYGYTKGPSPTQVYEQTA